MDTQSDEKSTPDELNQLARGVKRRRKRLDSSRSAEHQQATEIASRRLQEISAELIHEQNIEALYGKIVDAAVAIMRSDSASMQMLYPERDELRLLAHRGLDSDSAKFWEWVRTGAGCSCGAALKNRQRVMVPDVEACDFMAGTDDLQVYRNAGIRATQSTPLFSRSGKVVGMISTHWSEPHEPSDRDLRQFEILARQAADLIECRQAEEALRESEERYRALFDSTAMAVFVCDREGVIQHYNRRAVELWGREPMRGVEKHCGSQKLFLPDGTWLPHEQSPIMEVLRTGRAVLNQEISIGRPDGSQLPALVSFAPFRNAEGDLVGAIGSFTDITERKQAEAALRQSEDRLQAMFTQAAVGIVIVDLGGRLLETNDRMCAIVQRSREQLLALSCEDLTHPDDWKCNKVMMEEVAAGKRAEWVIEKRYSRPDGSWVWVNVAVSPLLNDQGRANCLLAVVQDIAVRKQAEEALRRSHETFFNLVQNAPLGVYLVDSQFRIAQVSTGARAAFRNVRPLIGHDFAAALRILWPEPFATEAIDHFRHTLATGESYIAPSLTHQRADIGTVESYEWQIHRVTLPDGQLGVVCYYFDATALRQSEQRMRESEGRFRMLAENISQLAWTCDQLGNVTWYNKRWLDYTGLSFEEMRDWGWKKVHHPDHVDRVVASVTRSRESGEVWEDTFPLRGKDGEYRWFLSRALPIRDEEGNVVRWFGTNTDVTEQRATEEALRQSEERYRSLVCVITDVPWTTDDRGAFSTPQPAWEAYTGQSWEEYRGFGWANALHPDDRERIRALWLAALDSRELYQSDGRLWHASDGQWRYFTAKAVPLLNADGSVREWVGTCTDVHSVKSAEEALRRLAQQEHEARAEAEKANRVKDQFLAMVSHELRTPLNAIAGWSHLLQSGKLDEETAKRALETIDRNAAAQATIINDLLDSAGIVSGKVQLDQQLLNLVRVIEAAMEVIQPISKAKGIEMAAALDSDAGMVFGDPIRLQQVIWNLLSNAVKFTPKGGCVEVKLEPRGPNMAIVVSDSGKGIDKDFLPHVFDRFRQADPSEKRAHDGLGLGLSIAHHLVEMHGGHIQAESGGREQGATFTITLPIKADANMLDSTSTPRGGSAIVAGTHVTAKTQARRKGPDEIQSGILSGLKVLVVDDQADARELLKVGLVRYGAEVRVCPSGPQALEVVPEWKPDIIVSDIGMPGEDGYEMMKRIRQLKRESGGRAAAIALTGYAGPADVSKALEAGYQTHLAKPVELDRLVRAVAQLGRSKSNQQVADGNSPNEN